MQPTPATSPNYKATVLIADDNPSFIHSLERLVRPFGVRCIYDLTSRNVHSLAKTVHPDVILLDVRQSIDGRDLLTKLKQDPATKDIPVVMLTAHDDQYTRRLCLELGAAEYAIKPIDVIFLHKLERLLGQTLTVH